MIRQRWVLTLAALALTAMAAYAGPIVDIIEQNYGAHSFVTVQRNGVGVTVPAGQFQIRLSSNPSQVLNTFCVDFNHGGPVPYKVEVLSTHGDGLAGGPQIAYLYGKDYGGGVHGYDTLTDNILAAAIQIAMFDLQEDAGDGLHSGFFQVPTDDAISLLAQQFINEALGQSGTPTNWFRAGDENDFLNPNRGQNQIGGTPPGDTEIPEPATFLLVGLGVAGLGFVGWRAKGRAGKA